MITTIKYFFIVYLFFINIQIFAFEKIEYTTQQFEIAQQSFKIKIPKNLKLEYVMSLEQPRIISISKQGEMFIGSKSGYIYRLSTPYNKVVKLLKLSNYPHSIVVRDGFIYIAQTNGLYRAPYRLGQKSILIKDVIKYISLPGGFGHNSRTVRLGPDNNLYVSLGISGNCSNQFIGGDYAKSQQRGGILLLQNTSENKLKWRAYATGLRNPVGFDWQPQTGLMYASNNGPDHWGFELPREYFTKVAADSFHGMPWYQVIDNKVVNDKCINSKPALAATNVTKPVLTFDARNAPMAVAFIRGDAPGKMLKKYNGDALVALRGSWAVPDSGKLKGSKAGRREPKLVLVRFENGKAQQVDDFLSGFQLSDGTRWARPIGVIAAPDGNIYFTSDDAINGLYRIKKVK